MYLDRKFGLRLLLSEITLLYDLSLYLDRTLAQRKAKSKVKVTQCADAVTKKEYLNQHLMWINLERDCQIAVCVCLCAEKEITAYETVCVIYSLSIFYKVCALVTNYDFGNLDETLIITSGVKLLCNLLKELITIKKLMHIHKFYKAGVPMRLFYDRIIFV